MIASLVLAVALAQGGYYTPAEAQQLFQQGNTAFDQANYDAAISAWQKLVDHGYESQDVFYNLGTAALKKNDLGHAVLWLERARRMGPVSEDLAVNLESARARQGDKVVGQGSGEPFVERVALATPRRPVTIGFLVAWLGAAALWLLFRFLPKGRRAAVAVLASLLLIAAVPLGALLAAHVYLDQAVREGVVMSSTVQARELPSATSKVSFEVHAGLKVRLLESDGGFVQIRLPNGLVGWAQREGIAQL